VTEQRCGTCRWFEPPPPEDPDEVLGWCHWHIGRKAPQWVSYRRLDNQITADDGERCDTWEEIQE
jgi:hypothetical protein